MNSKGQFSIIAALLVAVILIATVIITYSTIRNSPIQDQPQILSAIDETNLALKQILGFTIGYYGSVLQVTGNASYAKELAVKYLQSGLVNIANMHPEWGTSFNLSSIDLSTYWYTNDSWSSGRLAINYSLTGLGLYGVTYETSCKLTVQVNETTVDNQVQLNITRDEKEHLINLGKQNFKFYRYIYENSTWKTMSPIYDTSIKSFPDGTYQINMSDPALSGIDPYSYVVQVEDPRGIVVIASSFSRYTCTLNWNSTLYSRLNNATDATIVVELLQNGTMRWLGQNLQLITQAKPIPPIPVKAIHVNQTTIDDINREVPFQIEDWASDYKIPLGLTSNSSVFSNRHMMVFLVNPNVSKVTVWWNGSDAATQTSYAYTNKYFTQDDVANGILTNGIYKLILPRIYLYVNGFNQTYTSWYAYGASPYLNNDDSNDIYHNGNGQSEGWFDFQDLPTVYSQAFTSIDQLVGASIKIEFECKSDDNDYFSFNITDGQTTYGPYNISPPEGSNYGWRSYDITSIINTARKINNAKIVVTYRQQGSRASYVYIRRCRLSIDFWLTSVMGNSTAKADFMRINGEYPVYGAEAAYVIHHGIIRDIIQQEAEWSDGVEKCPNVYAHIVVSLPANATYYTYQLRLMFLNSQQQRNITDLCPIIITASSGTFSALTENGTNVYIGQGLFYNISGVWQHHWSQLNSSSTRGFGIMFTDDANKILYRFDSIAGNNTGALNVNPNSTPRMIELLPVVQALNAPANFIYALDVTWYGAVVTFDGTGSTPIYRSDGSGLWVLVEYPPVIIVTTET